MLSSAPEHVASERRTVTLLFCDVVDSTRLAEQMDAEEWTDIMNDAFAAMIGPVKRYRGTVARLMGDAMFAMFGAPVASEDDPQRAVLAALDIVARVRPLQQRLERVLGQAGLTFDVRVGINTALVIVGEVGAEGFTEYTAMGDGVNVAARMEQTAPPGTVQVGADTYRLVEALFDAEERRAVSVKGKAEPVAAYRIVGARSVPGDQRLHGTAPLRGPLVGREAEMSRLRQAFARLAAGRGGAVFLVGEAGLGKSRLVDELKAATDGAAHWLEQHLSSLAEAAPYQLMRDLTRSCLGVEAAEGPAAIVPKVEAAAAQLPVGLRSSVSLAWRVLLGAAPEDAPEGDALRRLVQQGIGQWLTRLAADRPLVLFIDDLHWADAASVDVLGSLLPHLSAQPILLLLTLRPQTECPGWRLHRTAAAELPPVSTTVELAPLDASALGSLLSELLATAALPAGWDSRLLDKADGNPFFLEELLRTLIARGVLARDGDTQYRWSAAQDADLQDLAVPEGLQGLLTARTDLLPPPVRTTLQSAAVLGRRFQLGLLSAVCGDSAEVRRHLAEAAAADLIEPLHREPSPTDPHHPDDGVEYRFRHALIRDAVYGSLLLKQRRELHLRVAEHLHERTNTRREAAALVAHHYAEAGDDRAAQLFAVAGDLAFELYANADAARSYERALRHYDANLDETELTRLHARRGRALELSRDYPGMVAAYEHMVQLGSEQQLPLLELAGRTGLADAFSKPSPLFDPDRAVREGTVSLRLARSLDRPIEVARLQWTLMNAHLRGGTDQAAGARCRQEALTLAKAQGDGHLVATVLSDGHFLHLLNGQLRAAQGDLREAAAELRASGDVLQLAGCLSHLALVEHLAGDLPASRDASSEAYRLSQQTGSAWGEALALTRLSGARLEAGEVGAAMEGLVTAVELASQGQLVTLQPMIQAVLTGLYADLGDPHRGLRYATASLQWLEQLPAAATVFLGIPLSLFVRLGMARAHLVAGQVAAAGEQLALCRSQLPRARFWNLAGPSVSLEMLEAWHLLASGDPVAALAAADRYLSVCRDWQAASLRLEPALLRVRSLRALGRLDDAAAAAAELERCARASGSARLTLPLLVELAAVAGGAERKQRVAAAQREMGRIERQLADRDLARRFTA